MADGEKAPSENFRNKHACLSDSENSENEEPGRLGLGDRHGKKRENHGASSSK